MRAAPTGGPFLPDLLTGLAPTSAAVCARCGARTQALANGRGRIDYCAGCGSLDLKTAEGIDFFRLRDLNLRRAAVKDR